jgi:hypothetical protein
MGVSILFIDTDTDSIPTGIDTGIDTLGMDANPGYQPQGTRGGGRGQRFATKRSPKKKKEMTSVVAHPGACTRLCVPP